MQTDEILQRVYQQTLSVTEAMRLLLEPGEKPATVAGKIMLPAIQPYFDNHTINGKPVLIGAYFVAMAIDHLEKQFPNAGTVCLRNLVFHEPVSELPPAFSLFATLTDKQQLKINSGEGGDAQHKVLVSARYETDTPAEAQAAFSLDMLLQRGRSCTAQEFFAPIEASGIVNHAALRCVQKAYVLGKTALCKLAEPETENPFLHAPALLNAGYAAFLNTLPLQQAQPVIMLGIKKVYAEKRKNNTISWVMAERIDNGKPVYEGDVYFFNAQMEPVIVFQGWQATSPAAVKPPATTEPLNTPVSVTGSAQMEKYLLRYIGGILKRPLSEAEKQTGFLQLGLDSDQLIKTVAALESDLKISLYPTLFFEYQNIAELAEFLSRQVPQLPDQPEKINIPVAQPLPPVVTSANTPAMQESRDIAIIGMGGRFPMADSPEAFLQCLQNKQDMISEIPAQRWPLQNWFSPEREKGKSYSKWGGFLSGITGFDAAFFNISPREARAMDPQLRLLLQVMYETAENAGVIKKLRGSDTGLYVGSCFREYFDEMLRLQKPVDAYDLTGSAMTFFANRPSYYFNLKGPSVNIDDACSSSLVALHLACQSLLNNECSMAFAAGVNLLISPVHYLHFCALEALSPNGHCFTFDAAADGYVPAESVCAVLLKPLQQALKDNDPILGIIKGSATNHGGKANSLTAPSIQQQTSLLLKTWQQAGIPPETLTYLEAHGTGTRLGDPVEVKALNNAFAQFTPKHSFCALGSAKAHLGHAEGAAGLVSVIKVLLMMKDRLIPAMPCFTRQNPLLELDNSPLYINTENEEWKRPPGVPLRAGISSFGMGGAYAHIVLEEPPANPAPVPFTEKPVLLAFSAFSEKSLRLYLEKINNLLRKNTGAIALEHLAHALLTAKETFPWRAAWYGSRIDDFLQELENFLNNQPSAISFCLAEQVNTDAFPLNTANVATAAQAWLEGHDIDIKQYWEQPLPVLTALPVYAFEEQAYWFETNTSLPAAAGTRQMNHPLLQQVEVKGSQWIFSATLAVTHPLLHSHKMLEQFVLPGVAHLEMAIAAAWQVKQKRPTVIENHYWYAPIIATKENPAHVVLVLDNDEHAISYTLQSEQLIFSSGVLRFDVLETPPSIKDRIDDFLSGDCLFRKGNSVMEQIKKMGAELDVFMQTIVQGFGKDSESLVQWQRRTEDRESTYYFPPAVLDAFNHGVRWINGVNHTNWQLKVPYHLPQMRLYADHLPATGYLFTQRTPNSSQFSCVACNDAGQIVYTVSDFFPREFAIQAIPVKPAESIPPIAETGIRNTGTTVFKEMVAGILEQPVAAIRDKAPLSDYGLDSVGIAQLIRQINQRFSTRLNPSVFFEHKTLESFAVFFNEKYPGKIGTAAQPEPVQLPAPSLRVATPVVQSDADIAILGMDAIFPGSKNIEAFWTHLLNGDEMISEIPADRFNWQDYYGDITLPGKMITNRGGFIQDVSGFDAKFFGISSFEAVLMDPQQRLLLQSVYRAVEHGGFAPESLRGKNIGVFIGAVNNEYYELLNENGVEIEGHTSTGMARSILPNRISSWFDWTGPSEAVDTACSSSLVAIHRAIQAIQHGECEMAIAGGCNLLLTPKLFISFSKAGMLAEDGHCKVFDEQANGYVRGEGIGVVLLKKKQTAVAAGDPVLAIIKGSGVNHGGHTNSLTTPNPLAQAGLLKAVWEKAGIAATSIGYIEAHGTGTPLGDPIEVNGIRTALNTRNPEKKLAIGSVKSNIGHLEAAAGIAGIIKVVMMMRHALLPATINFSVQNPMIEINDTPLFIVQEKQQWVRQTDAQGRPLPFRAGINSFGFGGANAHVLLEEFPENEPAGNDVATQAPVLLLLSAKTPAALLQQAKNLVAILESATPPSLANIAYTLRAARDQHVCRWALATDSAALALKQLKRFIKNQPGTYRHNQVSNTHDPVINETAAGQAAIAWINGGRLPAPKPGAEEKRIHLPGYVFDATAYWFNKPATATAAATETTEQPVYSGEMLAVIDEQELSWLYTQ